MGADVADRARPGHLRIGAPVGLLAAGVVGKPALQELRLHQPQIADPALGHDRSRLAHHRVGAVVVGQEQPRRAASGCVRDFAGLPGRGGQRLVADDVDAGVEKGGRHRRVKVVRRHHRHRADPVVARRFRPRHLAKVGIAAVEAEVSRRRLRPRRVRRQRACDQPEAAVHARGDAVDGADERALAAADHAKGDRRHHASPSAAATAALSGACAAKSSKAWGVVRMMWRRTNSAPSRAPSSGCFSAHSHSTTAQPGKS